MALKKGQNDSKGKALDFDLSMSKQEVLPGPEREELEKALYRKYGSKKGVWHHWTYWRKKYAWLVVVESAKFIKRFFDLFVALFMGLFLSPFLFFIAVLIKLWDQDDVFYISRRVGRWGKEFDFYKFRTMHTGAAALKSTLIDKNEHPEDVTFKMKQDPRITPIGKWLRKTSLDELPQLWNVFRGDMSLVGPRPHLPEEVEKYTLKQRRRLDVKPGITGIWQVGGRSDVPFKEQVKLDLKYIESQSFWLDCLLLLKTIPAVLFGRGAY